MKFSFSGNHKFTVSMSFNSYSQTYPISAIGCFLDEDSADEPP